MACDCPGERSCTCSLAYRLWADLTSTTVAFRYLCLQVLDWKMCIKAYLITSASLSALHPHPVCSSIPPRQLTPTRSKTYSECMTMGVIACTTVDIRPGLIHNYKDRRVGLQKEPTVSLLALSQLRATTLCSPFEPAKRRPVIRPGIMYRVLVSFPMTLLPPNRRQLGHLSKDCHMR